MHIIIKRAITESWTKYANARQSLAIWEERIKAANFKSHEELKEVFRETDYIPNENFNHLTVFNNLNFWFICLKILSGQFGTR